METEFPAICEANARLIFRGPSSQMRSCGINPLHPLLTCSFLPHGRWSGGISGGENLRSDEDICSDGTVAHEDAH